MLEIDLVVGFAGVLAVDGELGGVDIEDEVDVSLGKRLHALIVVQGVVDSIYKFHLSALSPGPYQDLRQHTNTDGIDAKLLEQLDVTQAGIKSEGIAKIGGSSGLVVNTTDVELSRLSVCCFISSISC